MAKLYCSHDSCRIDALQELVYVMRLKGTPMTDREIREKYAELGRFSVRCRIVPRNGAILAPLPASGGVSAP